MNKRWLIAPVEPELQEKLARELSIPAPVAQVLIHRGYRDAAAARAFLNPQLRQLSDPFGLPDMTAAVERILTGIAKRERFVIYGDYDVDGVTSGALLGRLLRTAGATVANFLPHRMDEGYGLSADGIARCLKEHKPDLLIAVDCGTSSPTEIAELKRKGVDVIVLDHHEPSEKLPECLLVNPKRCNGEPLASVGVAFKLAHALLKRDRKLAEAVDLRDHLDLVAVGTVADLVPLTGENRILVRAGLERLPGTDKVGLRALMDIADLPSKISPHHIGFRLGPRLNAAGRLGDATAALELLLTDDGARATHLAKLLHDHNVERQQIEKRIVQEALAQAEQFADDRVLVLENAAWHVGVIGIVASRVLQEYYRPTVIIGHGGKGSCRSITGYSIVAALAGCASLLLRYGGHEMAAGLSIKPGKVEEFRGRLNEHAGHVLKTEDLLRVVRADAVVRLEELDAEFFAALDRLEPCGQNNPTPVFAAIGLRLRGAPSAIKKKHLKFSVTDGESVAEAIWWGRADAELPAKLDIAFLPEWHTYQGEGSVQLIVRDVRASSV